MFSFQHEPHQSKGEPFCSPYQHNEWSCLNQRVTSWFTLPGGVRTPHLCNQIDLYTYCFVVFVTNIFAYTLIIFTLWYHLWIFSYLSSILFSVVLLSTRWLGLDNLDKFALLANCCILTQLCIPYLWFIISIVIKTESLLFTKLIIIRCKLSYYLFDLTNFVSSN